MKHRKTLFGVAVCLAMISSAGRGFAQTQLVSDNFDSGTNGAYLGPNWTGCGYNNGAYNELVYQNNEAGGSGFWGQDCALYTGYGAFPSDQYATGTIVAPTPSSSRKPQFNYGLMQLPLPLSPTSLAAGTPRTSLLTTITASGVSPPVHLGLSVCG